MRNSLTTRPLPNVAIAMLESLHEHRLLSTRQLSDLHTPGTSARWPQRVLRDLEQHGLIEATRGTGPTKLYYLTPAGGRSVQSIAARAEARRAVPTREQAAGPLRAHTLAVNQACIPFVLAARARGDDCGPLSWEHEIAHPIGAARGRRGREQVIADALLTYLRIDPRDGGVQVEQRFIELDRATSPAHGLATKLSRYARLHRHTDTSAKEPLWGSRYETFPQVLVVLTGASRQALASRRQTVLALCKHNALLSEAPQVRVAFCLLDELTDRGPFAPIFLTLHDPEHWTDWLGHVPRPGDQT